jgi:hypothetical protein
MKRMPGRGEVGWFGSRDEEARADGHGGLKDCPTVTGNREAFAGVSGRCVGL